MDAAPQINAPDPSGREAETHFEPFEMRLFRLSPLGPALTTLALLVMAYGGYILIAQLTRQPPLFITTDGGDVVLAQAAWIAFVLSLIFTAGTAFTEFGRRLWEAETPALVAAVTPAGAGAARDLARGIPLSWRRRYGAMFLAGAIAGLAFNGILILTSSFTLAGYLRSVGIWFVLISPLLYGIGFRAGIDLARESGAIKGLIREHLEVDLFHLDRLDVFGRIGLRAARSWLIMAGILLLFLINPNRPNALFDASQLWVTVPVVLASILGGAIVLTSALHPVHVKIRAAKQAELDRIHGEMARLRDRALAGDAAASSALAGLTDYEVWVNNRPEWPVSGGVTTRFSLYVLIPVIPIIGSYVFEKLADQFVAGGVS